MTDITTGYCIARIGKSKSWGDVAGAFAHNARKRQMSNADPKSSPKNKFLIGSPDDQPVAICKEMLKGQKIRKNAVYGVEGYLGASAEYFRPQAPEKYGHYETERLNSWVDASLAWLKERYGELVFSAVFHLDEATPHLHFQLLPLDEKGKLNCRALFGGNKNVLSHFQDDYHAAVKHLGLKRGRKGSQAKHTTVAEYYAAVQSVTSQAPKLPPIEDIELPEPPGTIARLKTDNLIGYAQDALENQTAQIEPILKTLASEKNSLTAENARLKEEAEKLKDANSRLNAANSKLSAENKHFKEVAKQMRGLDLAKVLKEMFGGQKIDGNLISQE